MTPNPWLRSLRGPRLERSGRARNLMRVDLLYVIYDSEQGREVRIVSGRQTDQQCACAHNHHKEARREQKKHNNHDYSPPS